MRNIERNARTDADVMKILCTPGQLDWPAKIEKEEGSIASKLKALIKGTMTRLY
jgi:hypothetical protein